jgi:hypothetical protein
VPHERVSELARTLDPQGGDRSEPLWVRVGSGAATLETGVVGAYEAFSKGVLNLRAETYESLGAALLRDFVRGEAAANRAIELQQAALSGQEGVLIVGAWMRVGHLQALQGRSTDTIAAYMQELDFLNSIDHALRNRVIVELNVRLGAHYETRARAGEPTGREPARPSRRLGARRPSWRSHAAPGAGLHRRGARHAGARHRRDRGDLQRGAHGDAGAAAVSRARSDRSRMGDQPRRHRPERDCPRQLRRLARAHANARTSWNA